MISYFQAIVIGLLQGVTELFPVSSLGHSVLIPALLGWDDLVKAQSKESFYLAFLVALHVGTALALLVYFRADWLRLIPAGLAAARDRSLRDDPDRRLAWLIAVSTVPGAILWLADRWGPRTHALDRLTFRGALGIGLAQALALIPGVSRSGISMSAALLSGLDRADAARYSFLMATPITALAVAYEGLKLVRGDAGTIEVGTLVVGVVAAFVAGILAIAGLLRYVRTRSFNIFVAYRVAMAVLVLVVFLAIPR